MSRALPAMCERISLSALMIITIVLVVVWSPPARSEPLPGDLFGVNFWVFRHSSPNLNPAASAGLRVARKQMVAGVGNADAIVRLTARAHLRLYPMLGLRVSHGASQDARAMAAYVRAFALRYGPHGSFWKKHPKLPYLPVRTFEIGNEPDMPLAHVADSTSLHYATAHEYALVYESARSALHAVDPGAKAVVGGLADFGSVTLARAESYLAALHPVDAVGYHPYRALLAVLKAHTSALRRWMNAHGDAGVPIDVNEFGASVPSDTSARWGAVVAAYAEWAVCTHRLRIESVQPFWWGGVTLPYRDPWLSLIDPRGRPTVYGSDYLRMVRVLTARGCPARSAG